MCGHVLLLLQLLANLVVFRAAGQVILTHVLLIIGTIIGSKHCGSTVELAGRCRRSGIELEGVGVGRQVTLMMKMVMGGRRVNVLGVGRVGRRGQVVGRQTVGQQVVTVLVVTVVEQVGRVIILVVVVETSAVHRVVLVQ